MTKTALSTLPRLPRLPRLLGAAGLSLLLLAGTAVQAQGGAARGDAGHHRMEQGDAQPRMIERALEAAGASSEQKTRVREIFKAAQTDLQAQRQANQALRQQMMALWTAPQPDAAAAEVLRQQQMAQHDAKSRRMMQAMLDAQAVLTPEQRQKLAATMRSRGEMMQRHHRERRALDAPRS